MAKRRRVQDPQSKAIFSLVRKCDKLIRENAQLKGLIKDCKACAEEFRFLNRDPAPRKRRAA